MIAATLMRGLEARRTEVAGIPTRYFVGGEGPPLVLVHGLGGAATNWSELAALLARRRRLLVPDLPGHGGSDPLPGLRDVGALADHVAALAEREAMVPAAVAGHSLGAVVGLRLAVRRPRAVRALALVSAAGIVSRTRRAQVFLAVTAALRPARAVARFRGPVARRSALRRLAFAYWGAADAAALSPEAALGFLEGAASARDVASAGRALIRDDPRTDLDRVRCPVLLLWGARDRLTPLADGFEYARRLRAPIRTIAAAGHLLPGERPRECAAVLDAFLDRVGEVDELPLEAELVGEPGRERADA